MAHMEAQAPEGMTLLALEVVQRQRNLLDRWPSSAEQAQTRIGERDAAGRAVQQSHAETLLELPHREAARRGRDADMRCRRPEAEIVGDGNARGQIGNT